MSRYAEHRPPLDLQRALAARGVSRRSFLKFCAVTAGILALPPSYAHMIAASETVAGGTSEIQRGTIATRGLGLSRGYTVALPGTPAAAERAPPLTSARRPGRQAAE